MTSQFDVICEGHTHLKGSLPFGSPEALAADQAAYEMLAGAFRGKGSPSPPSFARLVESVETMDIGVLGEATDRAARILGVPEPLRYRCSWVLDSRTLTLVVPWEVWDEDPPWDAWEEHIEDGGGGTEGLAIPTAEQFETPGAFDDIDSDLRLLRPISLHDLVERMLHLHRVGLPVWNPLSPMVRAAPQEMQPSTRTTRRILPGKALRGGGDQAPPRQGALFPMEGMAPNRGQTQNRILPGFALGVDPPRSPIMAVWQLGSERQENASHVVPIEQRIFVEALLASREEARKDGGLVEYPMTLADFLARIYPNPIHPKRRPSRSRYIPAIERAAAVLASFRIERFDERTGLWGRHRVVDIPVLPTWTRRPEEDEIRIRVDLPAGSHVGPQVSDQLGLWSVKSKPCWNAMIALPFMWGVPGHTLVQPKRGYWARSKERSRYPVLSPEEIVQVVYPVNQNNQPIKQVQLPRALDHLRRLERAGELVLEGCRDGWRVLPPQFLAQE